MKKINEDFSEEIQELKKSLFKKEEV